MITSNNQVGLSVERRVHQCTHKTFNPKCAYPPRCTGINRSRVTPHERLLFAAEKDHCRKLQLIKMQKSFDWEVPKQDTERTRSIELNKRCSHGLTDPEKISRRPPRVCTSSSVYVMAASMLVLWDS